MPMYKSSLDTLYDCKCRKYMVCPSHSQLIHCHFHKASTCTRAKYIGENVIQIRCIFCDRVITDIKITGDVLANYKENMPFYSDCCSTDVYETVYKNGIIELICSKCYGPVARFHVAEKPLELIQSEKLKRSKTKKV